MGAPAKVHRMLRFAHRDALRRDKRLAVFTLSVFNVPELDDCGSGLLRTSLLRARSGVGVRTVRRCCVMGALPFKPAGDWSPNRRPEMRDNQAAPLIDQVSRRDR
jgi:hypothetical protein